MAIKITEETFQESINTDKLTVIDFWAEWCGPCRMLGPIIDDLANENKDILIGKINVDEFPDLAKELGVRGIPCVMFFKDGKLLDKQTGVAPKNVFQNKINIFK